MTFLLPDALINFTLKKKITLKSFEKVFAIQNDISLDAVVAHMCRIFFYTVKFSYKDILFNYEILFTSKEHCLGEAEISADTKFN